MTTLSVVIPAYNEEGGIGEIVRRVLAVRDPLAAEGVDLELVIVNDGSKDRTAAIAGAYPGVVLLNHETNQGYGAALKTGFAHARGDWIAFLDADGTYPPESFPELWRAGRRDGAEMVVGSRMTGERTGMPFVRRVGNSFYARLLSLLSGRHISDAASGMRLVHREALPRLYPLPDGLHFTPAMSTRAVHEQLAVTEVPIPYEERVGRSKLSVVRDGTRFLHAILWTALSYNPVSILGFLGLLAIGAAGAVGAGLVIARLQGVTNLDPLGVFAVFAALVLGVAGVSTLALGATFNYLVSLFHRRRVRQGLFGRAVWNAPVDHHFGWMGLLAALLGGALSALSLGLAYNGWPISSLWLYLTATALLILVGLQLMISWVLMRVLEELSQREVRADRDLLGGRVYAADLEPARPATATVKS